MRPSDAKWLAPFGDTNVALVVGVGPVFTGVEVLVPIVPPSVTVWLGFPGRTHVHVGTAEQVKGPEPPVQVVVWPVQVNPCGQVVSVVIDVTVIVELLYMDDVGIRVDIIDSSVELEQDADSEIDTEELDSEFEAGELVYKLEVEVVGDGIDIAQGM